GLFIGALKGKKRKNFFPAQLLLIQFCFILLLITLQMFLKTDIPELFFYLYLLILGFFGGDLFVISNNLFLKNKKNYGLGYGMDLIGSFAGALITSAFLIPLFGIPVLIKYLILINSFCLIFIFFRIKKNIHKFS
ncbi:MAG: hypothetical protein ACOC6P_04360, partial [Candidatus Aminicenantaceae bacterium]